MSSQMLESGGMQSLYHDVNSAQSGDLIAFERLVNQTSNLVSSIALAIVRDLDSSEDVAQQVFIVTWQKISTLKNSKSFLPWLKQVTRHTAYNFLRDDKVDRKVVGDDAEHLLENYCNGDESDELVNPTEESLHRSQQAIIMAAVIDQLPEDCREIILLYYREEQSSKQVAELLELSEANVRKKLSRTREILKDKLLAKYGRLILSTAPTAGASSLVLASITSSSPVAAATIASSSMVGKLGFVAKSISLLAGAMVGVLGGVMGVILGTRILVKKTNASDTKHELIRMRNQAIIWVMVSGFLLAIAYEVDSGWLAPVIVYLLFALGIVLFSRKSHHIFEQQFSAKSTSDRSSLNFCHHQKVFSNLGMVIGLLAGFIGLFAGLFLSGRL